MKKDVKVINIEERETALQDNVLSDIIEAIEEIEERYGVAVQSMEYKKEVNGESGLYFNLWGVFDWFTRDIEDAGEITVSLIDSGEKDILPREDGGEDSDDEDYEDDDEE